MKILHMSAGLDGGGVERLLYDYYCNMDHSQIQFDFIKVDSPEGILEKAFKDMGCKIFSVPPIRKDFKEYCKRLRSILKNNKYDAIHCHGGYRGMIALYIAKKCKVPIRIAHSHIAFISENRKESFIRKIVTIATKFLSTNLYACSTDAAIWMWGKNDFSSGKVHIMKNAIDAQKFIFSQEKRDSVRAEYNLKDKFVIGNVGRFAYQKNHSFLIEIFREIKKEYKNAVLMLVGCGELEADVKRQVQDLKLEDSVVFMGVRNDVPDLLNAMDIFLLPSRFEGLGIVFVEAQTNGLKCYTSKDVVPEEANVYNRIDYISLDSAASVWAKKIIDSDNDRISIEPGQVEYDILSFAKNEEAYYLNL